MRSPVLVGFAFVLGVSNAFAQPVLRESETVVPVGWDQVESHHGQAMAVVDFDGDGYDDLIVGAPDYDVGDLEDAGLVAIYRGGPGRIPGSPRELRQVWTITGVAAGDRLGTALVGADFRDRGYENWLLIGVPGSDVGPGFPDGGAVLVYEFTPLWGWRLEATWRQGQSPVAGGHLPHAAFGSTIAVGDFNGDGRDDAAIGAPNRGAKQPNNFIVEGAGSVNYLFSNALYEAEPRISVFVTESELTTGTADQAHAHFGSALAVADFDGNGYDDLAIGVPDATINSLSQVGRVQIDYHGTSAGPDQVLNYGDLGGVRGFQDRFGAALAAGDFNENTLCIFFEVCLPDLAIGMPGRSEGAGGVVVVSSLGATAIGPNGRVGGGLDPDSQPQDLNQFDVSSQTQPEIGDGFGGVLFALEFNGLEGHDLAIGTPREGLAAPRQGMVQIAFGGIAGLGTYPALNLAAVAGTTSKPGQADDFFGAAIAFGNFDGYGAAELAVAVPGQTVEEGGGPGGVLVGRGTAAQFPGSGAVIVFSQEIFFDGFESGSTGAWNPSEF